jgi:5-formyltetrahydrofolate cyclo-ligase
LGNKKLLQPLRISALYKSQGNGTKRTQQISLHGGKITAMDNSLAKIALRKLLIENRPHSSEGLSERLIEYVSQGAFKAIASYQPLRSEPDITAFNQWAIDQTYEVWFPKVNGTDLIWGTQDLSKGSFGITEPKSGIPKPRLDLIIVPALAIDRTGNRLGKGKGFYDRALRNFDGITLAVVFEEELLESIPTEPHDFPVQVAMTPKTTLIF